LKEENKKEEGGELIMFKTVTYDIRNIEVGDEEETRLFENVKERIDTYRREGVEEGDLKEIERLLIEVRDGKYKDVTEYWSKLERVEDILLKYVKFEEVDLESLKDLGVKLRKGKKDLIVQLFDLFWISESLVS